MVVIVKVCNRILYLLKDTSSYEFDDCAESEIDRESDHEWMNAEEDYSYFEEALSSIEES